MKDVGIFYIWPLGLFYINLVYFVVIWYIFARFWYVV
jgi:hypothetical protein